MPAAISFNSLINNCWWCFVVHAPGNTPINGRKFKIIQTNTKTKPFRFQTNASGFPYACDSEIIYSTSSISAPRTSIIYCRSALGNFVCTRFTCVYAVYRTRENCRIFVAFLYEFSTAVGESRQSRGEENRKVCILCSHSYF